METNSMYTQKPYTVYVQTDGAGRITAVNSSAFVSPDWGTEIDSGYGDKYHHAQGNYFPQPIYTADGIPRYKLEDGKAVERTEEEIEADRAALPEPGPTLEDRVSSLEGAIATRLRRVEQQVAAEASVAAQTRAATRLYVQKTTDITDEQALAMPDLFLTWAEALAAGNKLAENTVLRDGSVLYRVVQSGGVTPLESQPPHGEGMLAVYRPIDQVHEGTKEDPIPFVYGMDTEEGKYYAYEGITYLCKQDMIPCVWPPNTPGLWQWEVVA